MHTRATNLNIECVFRELSEDFPDVIQLIIGT